MTDEELLKITESMQQKLGEENSAVIADDYGSLITANTQAQKDLLEKNEEKSGKRKNTKDKRSMILPS